ncbi:MAG: 30S ribosomal protein S20 [Candidatus Zambryskibacteria bacterium]|nr:30S ribosomal protein S20 [Candidatus Zambryskibacteria bacterium]
MPITKSAKKAHRASLRKRVFNTRRKDEVSKAVKSMKKLIAAGDKKAAQALMPKVQKALDKASKGRTLNRNTVSRKKARLSKMVKKLA